MNKKFIFFSSSKEAIPIFQELAKHFQPVLIISQPDKPQGRHLVLKPSPMSEYGQNNKIPVLKPKKLGDDFLKLLPRADFGFLFAYGKIIPQNLLNFFPHGIINLHPSLLPKYRGPSPVRQALLDCQKETGYSLMLLDKKMDHGPILYQEKVKISSADTWLSLSRKIIKKGRSRLMEVINGYLDNKIKARVQNDKLATYTAKISKRNGLLDLNLSAEKADCFIRAMSPWPGAFIWLEINGRKKRLKIHKAYIEKNKLNLEIVQLEGKKLVTWKQFIEGYPNFKSAKSNLL